MRAYLGTAWVVLIVVLGCSTEEAHPASSKPAHAATPSSASAGPQDDGAIVLKGSKTTQDDSNTGRSAADQARIDRLEASARASQGKGDGRPPYRMAAANDPAKPGKQKRLPGSNEWLDSLERATERARDEHKLILADFTGSDWCGYCMKLKAEVLDTQQFKDWATANAVLLEVDFPHGKVLADDVKTQNQKLRDKFQIQGFPTIVLFDATGKVYGSFSGYGGDGPDVFIDKVQKIVDSSDP